MRAFPLMQIKRVSEKERLQGQLQTRLDNINILATDKDYSGLINNFADAIRFSNELADIQADE